MNSKFVNIALLAFMIALTAGLVAWQRYGMNISFSVVKKGATTHNAYNVDDHVEGGESYSWLDLHEDKIAIECDIIRAEFPFPFCELAFQFNKDNPSDWIDLSQYDHIYVDLGYVDSPNENIKIQFKNTNPLYTKPDDYTSQKFNIVEYNPVKEGNQLTIALEHFKVPEWWTSRYQIPIRHSEPEFDRVTTLEISTGATISEGTHILWVKEVSFSGKLISYTQLITLLVAFWTTVAVLYLSFSLLKLQRGYQRNRQRVKELHGINRALDLHSQEMERQAKTDPLTGALNRAGVSESLLQWQTDVRKNGMMFSVIFCDIDHFKHINDNHGHATGDAVIVEIASLFRSHTRELDSVVRWGGEEFLLLCPNTSLEASSALAEKLRKKFLTHPWPELLKVTCSFGVGKMKPTENIEQFFKRADEALYIAKEHGRNRVEISE